LDDLAAETGLRGRVEAHQDNQNLFLTNRPRFIDTPHKPDITFVNAITNPPVIAQSNPGSGPHIWYPCFDRIRAFCVTVHVVLRLTDWRVEMMECLEEFRAPQQS
jgi:hypothetical protein